jgi:predicted regulator of Ras-like GTPase activity (Roadblock/LC7/MglB family)
MAIAMNLSAHDASVDSNLLKAMASCLLGVTESQKKAMGGGMFSSHIFPCN